VIRSNFSELTYFQKRVSHFGLIVGKNKQNYPAALYGKHIIGVYFLLVE
jgi:hypothetical protein